MITLRSPSSRIAIHHLSLAALVLATACHPDADHAGTESATDDPAALARAGSPGTTDKRDDLDDFAPIFAQHFGEPLDAAILAFDDYPTCTSWANPIALVECDQPEVPWDGLSWTAAVDLSCASDEVIGPLDDNHAPLMATTRTLVVDEDLDALAVVDFQGTGLAGARITRCGSCWDALDLQLPAGSATNIALPAGRYQVWFLAEVDVSGTMSLSLTS